MDYFSMCPTQGRCVRARSLFEANLKNCKINVLLKNVASGYDHRYGCWMRSLGRALNDVIGGQCVLKAW